MALSDGTDRLAQDGAAAMTDGHGETPTDGLAEMPTFGEERRMLKAAFERLSSPGLDLVALGANKSNAKMQTLLLSSPSFSPGQRVLSSVAHLAQVSTQMRTQNMEGPGTLGGVGKVNASASPFSAVAYSGKEGSLFHDYGRDIGAAGPASSIMLPSAPPEAVRKASPSPFAAVLLTPPYAGPLASASPFAAAQSAFPTSAAHSSSAFPSSAISSVASPVVRESSGATTTETAMGAFHNDSRQVSGQAPHLSDCSPGASAGWDFLNKVVGQGGHLPVMESLPPPVVGQLADLPTNPLVELELDWDRCAQGGAGDIHMCMLTLWYDRPSCWCTDQCTIMLMIGALLWDYPPI